jgi:membrane associated rhomboid family serine protease
MRARSPFALTPWVRGLLVANAALYLLGITVFTGPWYFDLFAFRPDHAAAHWWSFLTYSFLHGGFLHLAFNMLMLFFFGPAVEERLGPTRFALLYAVSAIGGAVFSFGLLLTTPVSMVIGASAAVFGVALAFAMFWPDAPFFVFPLPVPVKAKWLVVFLATVSLVAAIGGTHDGVAHLAHLGGFVFGFIFLRVDAAVHRPVDRVRSSRVPVHTIASRGARRSRETETATVPEPETGPNDDDVNRLLDKISQSGLESLTPAERRILDERSRKLRQH